MTIFLTLLANLAPLYMLIALGFVAGRALHIDRNTLANLAVYVFVPVVVFGFILNLDFKPEYALLPVVLYGIQAVVGLSFLKIGHMAYPHSARANILALGASMGNTGYFGIPLAMLLFTKEEVAIYVFMMMGGMVYEATIGYYIAARGRFDVRQSILKLLKFPTIYAMILAFVVKYSGVPMPEQFFTYWTHFKGAYVIAGMMIIGVALSRVEKFVVVPQFISLVFAGRFVLWPVLTLGFIALDKAVFHMFAPQIYSLLLVMAIVPPGANVVAFAAQLDLVPEKAAATILIGTVFALFYIPLVLMIAGVH